MPPNKDRGRADRPAAIEMEYMNILMGDVIDFHLALIDVGASRQSAATEDWQRQPTIVVPHPVVEVAWDARERRSCTSDYWQTAFLHLQVRKNARQR